MFYKSEMDPRVEHINVLISESQRSDRPEIRAKSSIGLLSVVSELSTIIKIEDLGNTKNSTNDLQLWDDVWDCITRSLTDEWPLVRETFQEQLVKTLQGSDTLRKVFQQPGFIDQILLDIERRQTEIKDRIRTLSGVLSLTGIIFKEADGTEIKVAPSNTWDMKSVITVIKIAKSIWTSTQEEVQKTSLSKLLAESFTGLQVIKALGVLATPQLTSPQQIYQFAEFCETILQWVDITEDMDHSVIYLQGCEIPSTKDWVLTHWMCDQLWIPSVFASVESVRESSASQTIAKAFVEAAALIMKCIGYILRIQTVDNTYTIHRLIIACASHTNDNDLWNRLSKSISKQTITEAWNNLTIIREKTPWSISSDGSIIPATEPNSLSGDRNNHRINRVMVPGSFSDHIIQIIEKELRPCFTHVKAQKLVDRAKTTITLHQDKIRKESGRMVEDISNNSVIPSSKNGNGYITAGENRELLIPHSQQRSRQPIAANQNRILIAPVTDTPNDEEENWAAMDTGEDEGPSITCVSGSSGLPSQSRRWDKTFLGSVPVVEWCAQQPIQDMNRIHEVFMLLVGPILAMTDSLQYQYRIRGLDMLTRFLIQYHDQDYHQKQPSTAAKAKTGTPQMDSKIWIKIFTRTGLDQVLERSLKPLLVPIQAGLTLTPQQQQQDSLLPIGDSEELEAISAAFRAYLTLILVNTEPAYKPVSVTDDSYTVSLKESNKGGLTVENLFVHAVLASFRRANPSREYKTVVLRWATVLIQPIISFDFIREELVSKDGYSRQRNDQKKHKTQNQQRTNPEKGSFSLEVSNSDIPQQSFQGIYGMGIITIKYLPTLIPYICGILDLYFPSSPPEERIKSLDLAWISSKALYMIMLVSKSRIPRYRGKILAALASCWANSRTYSDALSSESLKDAQARLDQSLVDAMGLIKQICQPKIAEDAQNGLEIDLKVLQNLDPPVFNPLFVPQ